MSEPKKTHQEYMALARVLGRHQAAVLSSTNPIDQAVNLALHFLADTPRCPMCLETAAKAAGGREAGDGTEQVGRK